MAYKKLPWKTGLEMVMEGFQVKTDYQNTYPYNVGACINGVHYADCWNFVKSLIWAWACGQRLFTGRTNNTFFYDGRSCGNLKSYNGIGASGLGDVDGATIISYCEGGGTTSFKNLVPMMPLYKPGHMALYVGEYKLNGKTYNACEYNVLSGVGDGLLPFWIDSNGKKYYHKNGSATGAKFTACGKLSRWIDYSNNEKTQQEIKHLDKGNLAAAMIRGYIGNIYIGTGEARKTALNEMGYSNEEISNAQACVNQIYEQYNYDKECADDAMRFISGEAGDGAAARKEWLTKKYGTADRFRDIQDKVNAYIK